MVTIPDLNSLVPSMGEQPSENMRTKSTAVGTNGRTGLKPDGMPPSNRSVSLMDRMNQLQNAQNSWQSKVWITFEFGGPCCGPVPA